METTNIFTIIITVIASSGFWAFLQFKFQNKDAKTRMLKGLGHDRIMYLGMCYIEQKEITQGEYENLITYLYEPYKSLGGNGSVEKVIDEVKKLEIIKDRRGIQ